MKKQICFLVLLLTLAAPCQEQMKLAVLEPEGKGLSNDELWMLSLVQSSIAADFNKYSSITIIDRQNLEAIIEEQKRSLSAITSDEDAIRIGNLANASHILTGKITKTPKTFMLELAITDAETGKRQASYSPKGITPSQVEDLSALKAAVADLLKQLGVSLTDSQLAELKGPATATQVQAQTALARGVVAERQGTSVAALSYFYQAAAFDPSLVEAVKRSSVMSANISGINIGENIRNDIVWRKKWVDVLKETEETFYKILAATTDPPYTLYYSTAIGTDNINYQKETADLSISYNLLVNAEWFNAIQQALKAAQAVRDGLNATNRKKDWGLDKWPSQGGGVSNTNPFGKDKCYDISVEFELVNQRGRVIGKKVAGIKPCIVIGFVRSGTPLGIDRPLVVGFDTTQFGILTFNSVNANDISDKLTIRIASVNGAPPKTARFPIIAFLVKKLPEYLTDSRDGKKYGAVEIGPQPQIWMAENLNFNEKGRCYKYDTSYCQKYGRLYDWETAKKACPPGWHLPSDAEWKTLVSFTGGNYAGKNLKAISGWAKFGTDAFGFSALPGGRGFSGGFSGSSFESVGTSGYWWSATQKGGEAYNRVMYRDDESVGRDYYHKGALFSVRCVQD